MTRQEFIARWSDEMRGLMLAAFAENESTRGKFDEKGRYMVNEMRKVPDLLGRMFDSLYTKPQPPVPTGNGAATQTKGTSSDQPQQGPRQPGR